MISNFFDALKNDVEILEFIASEEVEEHDRVVRGGKVSDVQICRDVAGKSRPMHGGSRADPPTSIPLSSILLDGEVKGFGDPVADKGERDRGSIHRVVTVGKERGRLYYQGRCF